MTTQEIFEAIEAATDELRAQHNATTKVSNTRARKAASEISKLVKEYRKTSLEENKQEQGVNTPFLGQIQLVLQIFIVLGLLVFEGNGLIWPFFMLL